MTDAVISNVIRSQVVEDYLEFFEEKDIEGIEDVLADDCFLRDWDVGTVTGKPNVMKVFRKIFSAVEEIEVNISHIHEDITGILMCEMTLVIDGEELLVVDIFEFDEDDRIKALRAYKGN
jgi:limonene-1,2-epoxide hydrolase